MNRDVRMNWKDKYKTGLYLGIGMAGLSILEDLLTKDNQTITQIIISIVSALVGSTIWALLVVWLFGYLSKFFKPAIHIETEPGEIILFEKSASHFKGIEAVGGKLHLTNKRLVFKSHKLNIQNHQLSIGLNEIEKVNRYTNFAGINNGLSVTILKDKTEKFLVEDPENWLKHLTESPA